MFLIDYIVSASFCFIIFYLIVDYYGPRKIRLKSAIVFGLPCLRANDLIVQEFDGNGNLWASRGMIIYRLKKGDKVFIRVAHIPCGLSLFWLNNFRIIRRLTVNPECIEMSVTNDGSLCALSAGYMWYRAADGKKFRKTFKLSHYGVGVGRGIFNGLLKVNDSLIFFGEYFRNQEKTHVRIYKSQDSGLTWDIAHEFQPGSIYHIHSLQVDPYTGKLWICTGDNPNESLIGWSDDEYKNIVPIGQGSLIWVACQLVFTEEAVYWGTDADSEDLSGIYCWDKRSEKIHLLQKAESAFFYVTRLANGTMVMSTDREGLPIEKDDITVLYIIDKDDKINVLPMGTWNHKKSGFRFRFAKLRLQRYQGNDSLIISCLNQKEIVDGELIMISENTLNSRINKK